MDVYYYTLYQNCESLIYLVKVLTSCTFSKVFNSQVIALLTFLFSQGKVMEKQYVACHFCNIKEV